MEDIENAELNVNFHGITPREELFLQVPREILPESAPEEIANMSIAEFLPSRIVKVSYLVDSSDLTIWDPITIEAVYEIGPRRMWVLFFNGINSLILQYIFWEKKMNYSYARRRVSHETYDRSIKYIKYRIDSIERAITASIKKQNLPMEHERVLLGVLKEQLDRGFRFRRKSGKNGEGL
ncbi:MAG: hypothetical protein WC788_05105 [Candidatus Paceibacterota bacterium]|jgi:hypothetical protein